MSPSVDNNTITTYLDALPSVVSLKSGLQEQPKQDTIQENYDGSYQFAPIEEAMVSRAMIKRWDSYAILSTRIGRLKEYSHQIL